MNDKDVENISSKAAFELLEENPRSVFVDVRSSMEYLFVGHPVGVIHLPWIDEPDWEINPHFVSEVRKLMLGGASTSVEHGGVPVILICRSGKRSAEAGKVLVEAGINNVFNVDEGFEGDLNEHHQRSTIGGWRFHGLPWEQC